MTAPTSPEQKPLGPRPPRLLFLTLPLLIGVFYNAISLLTLPFTGPTLTDVLARLNEQAATSGLPPVQLSPDQLQWVLWLSFAITAVLILWLYYTRRALLEGRNWGRVSAIVIGVFTLLVFPVGTVLGIFMLIGAFDKQVMAYTRH
ncbi:hypothetical protein GCM10010840_00010 [Deinococcus aerolatus]|uniref:Yip1 domain-containing protein n=1 Tax=Deinococcus aerolatus TaxID=522487 RepID=A0ABQ2FZ23_9DEIO|nr:hypothetical protein [Deinococcus aerolatus]GGL66095.1 hypothetical protein GCM10010840_00010 [Deinococcus aerolatus]